MGQIIGGAAKPKRCNLNKLSQLGTPAAGEYILVSSDNSMNAAGQGNFDCYIVGNGTKAATELELKIIADFVYGRKTNKTTLQEFYWLAGVSDANHPLGGINYIASNQGYAVSNFIDVHNAHKISFISLKGTGNNTVRYYAGYAFYDSNKNALSGHKTTITRTYEVEAAEVEIPSGAYYFRYTTDINTEGCNEYTIWKRYDVAHGLNIVDNTVDGGSEHALSAEQGKILNNRAAIDTVPLSTPVLKTSAFINALISDASYGC